jgi:hypothetical protein
VSTAAAIALFVGILAYAVFGGRTSVQGSGTSWQAVRSAELSLAP